MTAPPHLHRPLLSAALLASLLTAALLWPLPLVFLSERPLSSFHDGHIWAFHHIARLLFFQDPWSMEVPDIGWPTAPDARYIAWLPAVLVAPLQPLLGPIGAYNVALLLMPALNVAAAGALLGRLAPRAPWVVAAGALLWAMSPYALGSLANGQICKLQLWVLPLWAAALTAAVEDARPGRGLIGVAAVALVGSFSEPSYALHLPFLGAAWGLGLLVRAGSAWPRALGRGLVSMGLTGLALLPAWAYYAPPTDPSVVLAHQPATRVLGEMVLTQPSSVATLRETFFGDTGRDLRTEVCNHPTYLVLPVLIVALLSALRRPGWRVAGLATLLSGLALATGERLVGGADYVRYGGSIFVMPAQAIAALGYPLAASGMYYRLIAVAGLGLIVLLTVGLAERRRGGLVAVVIALIGLLDAGRSTRALWPRPVAPVAGAAVFAEMAADPEPGAVLDLPVYHRAQLGSEMVLASLLHGRPTTALPRNVYKDEVPLSGARDQLLRRLIRGDPHEGRSALREAGFRWVVLHTLPPPPELDLDGLQRLLGTPVLDGPVLAWRLDGVAR